MGVGTDFEYEVITQEDWIGRRMLADRFRDRRVFICGDAAHIWVPSAGLRHECRHRRCDEFVVDAGWRAARLGRSRHSRRA